MDEELLDISSSTASSDWAYLSEGGESIVFAYIGETSSELTGKVLRLRKVPLDRQDLGTSNEDADITQTLDFHHRIITRLVPPSLLPSLRLCVVSPSLLSPLADSSHIMRPSERSSKDVIDIRQRRAVLATNLVGSPSSMSKPTLAIEIKPKWAFLPNLDFLSPETRLMKSKYSRFTMHEHYRLVNKRSTGSRSAYDPLDLFSGEETRVLRALGALWDAWEMSGGRKNNFRIFLDGKVVGPEALEHEHVSPS